MSIHSEIFEELNCPNCGEQMIRLKRRALMRFIGNSRHVYCNTCHERYFKIGSMYIRLSARDILLR